MPPPIRAPAKSPTADAFPRLLTVIENLPGCGARQTPEFLATLRHILHRCPLLRPPRLDHLSWGYLRGQGTLLTHWRDCASKARTARVPELGTWHCTHRPGPLSRRLREPFRRSNPASTSRPTASGPGRRRRRPTARPSLRSRTSTPAACLPGSTRRTTVEPGVVVHVHGGGFVFHDIDVHDALARRLANRSRLRVLSVDYRRAPEARFPAAVDDVDAALRLAWRPAPPGRAPAAARRQRRRQPGPGGRVAPAGAGDRAGAGLPLPRPDRGARLLPHPRRRLRPARGRLVLAAVRRRAGGRPRRRPRRSAPTPREASPDCRTGSPGSPRSRRPPGRRWSGRPRGRGRGSPATGSSAGRGSLERSSTVGWNGPDRVPGG